MSNELPDDFDADRWAKALVQAVGRRQARSLLSDYRQQSTSGKVTQFGREVARVRAEALAKILDRKIYRNH